MGGQGDQIIQVISLFIFPLLFLLFQTTENDEDGVRQDLNLFTNGCTTKCVCHLMGKLEYPKWGTQLAKDLHWLQF